MNMEMRLNTEEKEYFHVRRKEKLGFTRPWDLRAYGGYSYHTIGRMHHHMIRPA
jgi:hypothetical protein